MNQIILIKIVIQLALNVLKLEAQQVIIVMHVLQDIHLCMEKEIIVMLIKKIMKDIIKMKMMIHGKNAMILVENVQEKQHVQNVLQDITLFIINLVFVFLINQMTVIMMKKMIHLKNVMILVLLVVNLVKQMTINVMIVQNMIMEHINIISFMINQVCVFQKIKQIKMII